MVLQRNGMPQHMSSFVGFSEHADHAQEVLLGVGCSSVVHRAPAFCIYAWSCVVIPLQNYTDTYCNRHFV